MKNVERGLSEAYVKAVKKDVGSCWDCTSFYFVPGEKYGCLLDKVLNRVSRINGCEKKVQG